MSESPRKVYGGGWVGWAWEVLLVVVQTSEAEQKYYIRECQKKYSQLAIDTGGVST